MLNALRAGMNTKIVEERLSPLTSANLFLPPEIKSNHWETLLSNNQRESWGPAYQTFQNIAEFYSLTALESKCYSTIPLKEGNPVFCPFYILLRPQVQENGWDWNTWPLHVIYTLSMMRKNCNCYVDVGYGKPQVESTILTCEDSDEVGFLWRGINQVSLITAKCIRLIPIK